MAVKSEFELLWGFSLSSALVILVRIGLRKYRRQKFTLDDYLVLVALVCLLARLGVLHGSYVYGTNFIAAAKREGKVFSPEEIRRREIGSKLSLTSRGILTLVLWLLKFAILGLCYRLIKRLSWARTALIAYTAIFIASGVSVIIVIYTECIPFNKHWQVVPDPGKCAGASRYLVSVFVTSIITDIMLVILPLFVLFRVERPFWEKVRLMLIFCVGFLAIAAAAARWAANYSSGGQVRRATFGSIELLASAIVANFPTMYGLIRSKPARKASGYSASGQSRGDGYVDLSVKHDNATELTESHVRITTRSADGEETG